MAQKPESLKDLTVRRSSIKGQITRFKKYMEDIVSKKSDIDSVKCVELGLKLGKMEMLSSKFEEVQSEIEILNSEYIDREIDERDVIECELLRLIAQAKCISNEYKQKSERSDSHFHCSHDHQEPGIKLPQIQIAKFDGAYFRWLDFRDTFTSLVHKNERISSIQRFHYLISYLEGEAARIISNLEVSSDNYDTAWSLLCERYDNKRLLVNHHLNALFSIQPIARETERSLRFLVDTVTKNLRALTSLGQPTNHWDMLIIYMLSSKLDSRTLEKWEETRNGFDDLPTFENFHKFLTDRADVLEALSRTKKNENNNSASKPSSSNIPHNNLNQNSTNQNKSSSNNFHHRPGFSNNQTKSFASTSSGQYVHLCIICDANHRIYDCALFKAKSLSERMAEVSKFKLCVNCLRQGHPVSDCRMGPCQTCNQRHNTLLHDPASHQQTVVNFSKEASAAVVTDQVLLSTALIEVKNPHTSKRERVRALLDCGSQSSFITKSLQKRLGLQVKPVDVVNVVGVGNNLNNKVNETCVPELNSINSHFSVSLSCFILDELTGELPKSPLDIRNLKIPETVRLADPHFDRPAPVDVLIGADIFWDILGCDQRSLGPNNPKLRSSKFGWLIAGPISITNSAKSKREIHCNHAVVSKSTEFENFDEMLTKFWSLEELSDRKVLSPDDQACENIFKATTSRLDSGRFCVELPLKDSPDCLGESYNLARKRFFFLEKRFKKNPKLKSKYTEFIREYTELGHLSESPVARPDPAYFLCHHAVIKECSESTKLRVVFNGSEPTSSGYSVNDILLKGPHVQDSLFSILIRARQHQFLITGDVDKFYRQVCVAEKYRNLQLILWREEESMPLKTYRLNTLTYGTASASYLSTRCLKEVGEECQDPAIRDIIQHDFYIDDWISGCDNESDLQYILTSVTETLKSGCFKLRKFKTNAPQLLNQIMSDNNESLYLSESTSTLGLGWNPAKDVLHFPFEMPPQGHDITKRYIMSNSFKIFDPLGLLSPCIIQPKILLQKLWQAKVDWDEPVPKQIKESWCEFESNLPALSSLTVPRKALCNSPKYIEMHVFSDASQCAYGACVYMKSIDNNDSVTVKLLCAKSKVSPLKPTTIPRLELCGALLAARLSKSVVDSFRLKPFRIVYWCDSSVVLSWLKGDPSKLKTFVANRVGEILEITGSATWRYVPTDVNPADMISRGVNASQLRDLELWWSGPDFLNRNESKWPSLPSHHDCRDLPEIKSAVTSIAAPPVVDFADYSKMTKLQRTYAYVKRFIYNLKNSKNKRFGYLTVDELKDSLKYLCSIAQRESFPVDYKQLAKGSSLNHNSKLLSLSPFLDKDDLIRVGGRIDASKLSHDMKHPIVLDSSHHLSKLIFEREHLKNLHAGPQLLLASVRQTIWPINGRRLARQVFHRCVRCRRVQGKVLEPKMGQNISQRLTPENPFVSVGLDYAGPFQVLTRKGRGAKLQKVYMCLFVCLRYKCLHLEAVSDLSKNAFMMTLRRFVARRGKPAEIFSDNGGNFIAACKELGAFLKQNSDSLSDSASQEGIKFNFSPSYAPHFGGIWEAGVKSAKYHIRRIMGNTHLTFEEISTLFAQVEAILNSRPLCPLSSSPTDLMFLSPGHFLIGRPLTAMASPNLIDCKESNLQRYARVEKIRQHFWKRWQKEYISELQLRNKWKTNSSSLKVGDLVLLHEEHVHPLGWRLGRVTRLFLGPDGLSRVADVLTSRGSLRRALVRLCPLLAEEDLHG